MGKIAKHKKDLESLKQKDPEFYQFLEENDNSMLEFGEEQEDEGDDNEELFNTGNNEEDDDDDLEAIEFGSDDDEEEVIKPKTTKKKVIIESDIIDITSEMLDTCIEKCHNTNSYLSIKKLLVYFLAACIPFNDNDSDDDDDNNITNNNKEQYTISSPEVYNEVMTKVLDNYHIIINNLFLSTSSPTASTATTGDKKNKTNKANETALTSSPSSVTYDFNQSDKHIKWKKYQSLIISFFKSVLSAISGIHNPTSANTQVGIFLLASLKDYISLLGCLPRLSRSVLKALLVIWSQGPVPAEDTGNLRGNALLRIRQV